MSQTTLFRSAIVFLFILNVITVFFGSYFEDQMPLLLQQYLADPHQFLDWSDTQKMMILGASLAIVILAYIGMWIFKPWGRTLYCVSMVMGLVLYRLLGPQVLNEWEAIFTYLSDALEGVLLLWMFTGDIKNQFKRTQEEH